MNDNDVSPSCFAMLEGLEAAASASTLASCCCYLLAMLGLTSGVFSLLTFENITPVCCGEAEISRKIHNNKRFDFINASFINY